MKLALFNEYRLGVVVDGSIADVTPVVGRIAQGSPQELMTSLISDFDSYRSKLEAAANSAPGIPVGEVRLRAPLPRPCQIDCMAVNYIEPGLRDKPAPIMVFLKAPTCVIGNGDAYELPDAPASVFEAEPELGVVIGKHAEKVKAEDAMNYVFGYTSFIDGSARGLGPSMNIFYLMKSYATFGPMGPYLVTEDEVPNPHELQIQLWNSGTLMNDFNTADMAHKIPECIEYITAVHPLEPGDLIATGTNHFGLHPLQDGDELEMEISGLGRLHVPVVDGLKRTWVRETRKDRLARGLTDTTPQSSGPYAPVANGR